MNIRVSLWGKTMGYAHWNSGRKICVFEYEPDFVETGLNVSPLQMPLEIGRIFEFPALSRSTFLGLPSMLADSLPDDFGNHIMNSWLAREGLRLDSLLPVERLSYVGSRGMGALEYIPEKLTTLDKDSQVDIHKLVEIANRVFESKTSEDFHNLDTHDLENILRIGTSAGGARAKAILAYDEKNKIYKTGDLMHPGHHSYWLLKMDGVSNKNLGDPVGYGKIEYAYYLMAMNCGIHMMPSKLLHENKRSHFITQRFDRKNNEKIHMQTLGGLAAMDYRQAGLYSYEQVFAVLRKMHMDHESMEQQFRRMVFNILARNHDDHVKNISCLMDQNGTWSLSPAYDLCYSYNPEGIWTNSHQLSVNGKQDHFVMEDLLKIGRENNISQRKSIIKEISEVLEVWESYADEAGIEKAKAKKIRETFRQI